MDLATIIGIISGFGLIVLAIVNANEPLATFQDSGSAMIVIGGSMAALFVSFPLKRIFSALKVVKKAVFADRVTPNKLIEDLVSYAEIARRDGILALENMTHEVQDEFIVRGIQMAVDGTDPELIEQIMVSELEALQERHKLGKSIFDTLTKYAPAFGMIGTLIGLIIMLQHMEDPSSIGSAYRRTEAEDIPAGRRPGSEGRGKKGRLRIGAEASPRSLVISVSSWYMLLCCRGADAWHSAKRSWMRSPPGPPSG